MSTEVKVLVQVLASLAETEGLSVAEAELKIVFLVIHAARSHHAT